MLLGLAFLPSLLPQDPSLPTRYEVIKPIRIDSFNHGGTAKKRIQGGNPRTRKVSGFSDEILIFDGAQDGNRQVDPQIAVGSGYVLHGTNSGLTIYDKKGNYLQGVPQSEFNGGIDPKAFYDPNNRFFCFDLWNPWDEAKQKPVNISVSETKDPTGAWNTYPVPAPGGVDGGGIGGSTKWIGYSFPGGPEQTFVMSAMDAQAGKPVTVYHFKGSLGHPVHGLDKSEDVYFVKLNDREITITQVGANQQGSPVVKSVTTKPHGIEFFGWPPQSPMKSTDKKTSSGDRNPKYPSILRNKLYFSHTVNRNGRAAVQFHEFALSGERLKTGVIESPTQSYIQTTMAVNLRGEALIGYQETSPDMFISARASLFSGKDWSQRKDIALAQGSGPTEGGAWGDYSSTVLDGDNFLDFWTAQSYANTEGRGPVVIARVRE